MASVKLAYGTATAVTCTLTSLASSATAGRESATVDNTSALSLDALVLVQLELTTGTIANDKCAYVYAWGVTDGASPVYPDKITGSDAAITFDSPRNLRLLGVVNLSTSGGTFKAGPWSVAAVFGGVLPPKWGLAVQNYCGIALSGTAGNQKLLYVPVTATVA